MPVCVGREKRYGEHVEDGRGVPAVSVSIELDEKTQSLTKHPAFLRARHISKRKRVSLSPLLATDL